ncbi:MAG: helix-turn-helix domain-containing protein [Candidatus Aminicenantales bacterium]
MEKKYEELTIHQKIEALIREMVDKEVRFKDAIREFQKVYIEMVARKFKGNKTKMASALGMHRNTLHNRAKSLKIKKYI